MNSNTRATSIKIYLADGTPEGLRIVEKSNWTGKALVCSRAQFPLVKDREEFSKTGVYVLLGEDEEKDNPAIYIGEGDPVLPRLENHTRNKDFWTKLILFTSKDSNLNKAYIQYIEASLVSLALKAKRYEVDNANNPSPPSLSETDLADANAFFEDMLVIYSVLGVSAFQIPEQSLENTNNFGKYTLKIDGTATATGSERPEGFIVYKGSKAKLSGSESFGESAKNIRRILIEKEVMRADGGYYVLDQDYTFSSPSQASSVLLARSSNGRTEWKDSGGITLKVRQEES